MPDHTNQLVPLPWTSRKGWNKSNYYNYFITTFVNNNSNNNKIIIIAITMRRFYKKFDDDISKLGLMKHKFRVEEAQKIALLGTAHIASSFLQIV